MLGIDASVIVGYRAVGIDQDVDRDKGTVETSFSLHGPIVGLNLCY